MLRLYSVEANAPQLVNRLSATPDFIPHPLPIDRQHVLMNKFYEPNDPGYVSVAGMGRFFFARFLKSLPSLECTTML
jgi:hypothetical protein